MLVGIDNLEVGRMEKFLQNEKYLNKIFTPYEAAYVNKTNNKTMRLAGIYCVKEAFLKALGIGIKNGVDMCEIEVNHDDSGKPFLKLSDAVKMKMMVKGVSKAEISITHTSDIAIAICLLY